MIERLALMLCLVTPASVLAAVQAASVCELIASLAPDWLESHEAGKTLDEITGDAMAAFDRAGLTEDTDHGVTLRTAAKVSLIGLAQNDPANPADAAKIAKDTCATWYRSRGRSSYQIPDRPLLWD